MKYYIVDAFAEKLFSGNPAGVCLLESELPEDTMQNIACENNLAETAFLLRRGREYSLRWFTPEIEMDLCGHATLATAFVLMNFVDNAMESVSFGTRSGVLTVERAGGIYTMDFPARPPSPIETPALLAEALGAKVLETHMSRDLLAVLESEDDVKNLRPDTGMISTINSSLGFALIVTAEGVSCDFVSRFFAPNAGIVEDPVTGSSHGSLIPFWSKRLNKNVLAAKQLSRRGGTLYCEAMGERVKIGGRGVCYLAGEIFV